MNYRFPIRWRTSKFAPGCKIDDRASSDSCPAAHLLARDDESADLSQRNNYVGGAVSWVLRGCLSTAPEPPAHEGRHDSIYFNNHRSLLCNVLLELHSPLEMCYVAGGPKAENAARCPEEAVYLTISVAPSTLTMVGHEVTVIVCPDTRRRLDGKCLIRHADTTQR